MLEDPAGVLGRVEFSLSNVLVPECTNGQAFDALYCDATASEEELPMLLSLLKPNGRMVVIMQEVGYLVWDERTLGFRVQGRDMQTLRIREGHSCG